MPRYSASIVGDSRFEEVLSGPRIRFSVNLNEGEWVPSGGMAFRFSVFITCSDIVMRGLLFWKEFFYVMPLMAFELKSLHQSCIGNLQSGIAFLLTVRTHSSMNVFLPRAGSLYVFQFSMFMFLRGSYSGNLGILYPGTVSTKPGELTLVGIGNSMFVEFITLTWSVTTAGLC